MLAIKFTATASRKLSADKTIWYPDNARNGLRLCVTAGGTKT